MNNDRWLLPEGIEELLPPQAQQLEVLRRRLLDLFSSWGYEMVMPPLVEYLDSLLTGTGNDLDIQTFKLTDQLNGRLMGVRADITPQVARIDSHRLGDRKGPVRLCYQGTVLHTRGDGLGGSRSFTQIGAELYGHAAVESDAEMVCLMLDTLKTSGIDQVYVDLGHVGIFRSLSNAAGLNEEQESRLFDALQRKAATEIETLLSDFDINSEIAKSIEGLAWLNGDVNILNKAREQFSDNPDVVKAIDDVSHVAERVTKQRPEIQLNFDFAELRGFHYHTGIVFAAYQQGQGRAIAQGGRYDDIGKVFGRSRPATGFSADLRALAALGGNIESSIGGIFAPSVSKSENDEIALIEKIKELRDSGERVVCELAGQVGGASESGCDRVLIFSGGKWTVEKNQ